MKKLPESLGEHLPAVKLFREDIEELYGLFKDESEKVEIEADGFKFSNLDDLFSYREVKINKLKFGICSPCISISFAPDKIWLYSSDETNLQYGMFEKIKKSVKKRINYPFLLVSGNLGICVCFILVIVGINFLPIHHPSLNVNDNQSLLKGFLFILLGIVWFVYSYKNTFNKHSQIYLVYKKDDKISFFARYKDSIFTIIITAISVIISHEWK